METFGFSSGPEFNASLEALPDRERAAAKQVTLRFPAYIRAYPERILEAKDGEGKVYQHPHPLIEIEYIGMPGKNACQLVRCRAPFQPSLFVFISYSHRDATFLAEFCSYLGPLRESGKIGLWHDKKDIELATNWEDEIRAAIEKSRAAVLLISQDFLNSGFIKNRELPMLFARIDTGPYKMIWIPLEETTIDVDQPRIRSQQTFPFDDRFLRELSRPQRRKRLAQIGTKLRLLFDELEAVS